jgi:hypothetical protein
MHGRQLVTRLGMAASPGSRGPSERWRLALLYSAGMVLLALGAAVIVIGAYLVGTSGR